MQLSRHEAVRPGATVTMCMGIAELQVEQAQGRLAAGEPAVAAALLAACGTQLRSAEATAAEAQDQEVAQELHAASARVLVLLAEAHIAAGEPAAAVKCLQEFRDSVVGPMPGGAQRLLLQAKLAAGEGLAAVQLLHEAVLDMRPATSAEEDDGAGEEGEWLATLGQALPALPAGVAPAVTAAVEAFLAHAGARADLLLHLTRVLVAAPSAGEDGGGWAWQRALALQVLASEQVIAALLQVSSG